MSQARLLTELTDSGESFSELALRVSRAGKAYFLDLGTRDEERLAEFAAQAQESLARQASIEAGDKGSSGQFLDVVSPTEGILACLPPSPILCPHECALGSPSDQAYKNGVQALQGVDLDVEQGDFFALLGPTVPARPP